jgi:hypothetical protein
MQTNASFKAFNDTFKEFQLASAISPSEFGKSKEWPEQQAIDPILCLRPASAIGLPPQCLYEGFREFLLNISNPDLKILCEAADAAGALCQYMGDPYNLEIERSARIDEALKPLWPKWEKEFTVKPFKNWASGRVDRASAIGLLWEHKLESGSSKSDPHMQICRCYQLYAQAVAKEELEGPDFNHEAYVAGGCPAFLVVIQGMQTPSPLALHIV